MTIWCKSDSRFSAIFIKTFLEQSMRICKWVSWWCHRLTISMYFVHRNDANPIFQLRESKTCLISTLNKCRMFALIYFDMGTYFYMFEQNFKMKIFKSYILNTWKIVRRWHHQLTYLNIHIDCSRNVWLTITKIQNFLSSLFLSDLHQIFTVLFEMF